MRAKLLRGFMLGDFKVEPLKGRVTSNGLHTAVSPEALDVLLHLASQPGEYLPCSKITDKVWGRENDNHDALEKALEELNKTFGQKTGAAGFFENNTDHGCRLMVRAKVVDFPETDGSRSINPLQPHLPLREIQPEPQGSPPTFWQELRKRRVVRVGIGYLIMAWLLLQVADVVFPVLGIPDWSMKLLALLLAAGFAVTLVVTWLVQLTPDGLILDTSNSGLRNGGLLHLVELFVILLLLVGASILVYRQVWTEPMVEISSEQLPVEEEIPALKPIPMPAYERSIAVLPFVNLGEDPADGYIGEGIAEELLHKLARIRNLKVVARTSSFHYARESQDIPTIAGLLSVMTVLEGSIRRNGDRIRVTAQLVDSEGFHLWSEVYDYDYENMIETQSNIALTVARRTLSVVTPETSAWLIKNETEIPEAFNAYLKGLANLRKPRQPENLAAATDWFEQAMGLDPRFARAWAGACETQLSWYRLNRDTSNFEQAERFCNRALTLDADSQEVFTALGNLYRSSSQYDLASEHFKQALEINPYNEEATYGLARSLQGLGDLNEAERLLRHCIELEPGYWGPYTGLGAFLFRQGRYDEAATYFAKVTELEPDGPDGYTNLSAAYFQADNWEDAEVALQQSLELSPSPMAYRNLGTIYYYSGRYEDAAAMHREAVTLAPEDHWLWGKLGAAYREISGEEENSLAAYHQAIELSNDRLEVDVADAETMAYLSAYYLNVGNEELAIEYIQNATELEPEKPEIWYFSGLLNAQLENTELALQHITNAVELGYSKRLLAADPQLAGLSNLDEFQRLIQ